MSTQDGNSGDEDEDSSSSFAKLSLRSDPQPEVQEETQDALELFRQQWQRELESSPARRTGKQAGKQDDRHRDRNAGGQNAADEMDSKEEQAKQLFVRGAESERQGCMDEAVWCYRRALQLVPDIELRLHRSAPNGHESDESLSEDEIEDTALREGEEEEETDLLLKFHKIISADGQWCHPEVEPKGAHVCVLPMEVFLLVLRWVVGAELDAVSLVRASAVCRGWYMASRDHNIWQALCRRTWGINCGTLKGTPWSSWQQMYAERPRLRFHGCYISKTSYLRHGENSFQDAFYKPWHLVQYYRYLRFFPDGTALMLTTADEPGGCVGLLRHRTARTDLPLLTGHYRLLNNKVLLVMRKPASDKKVSQNAPSRFKSRRGQPIEPTQQTFHLELCVCGHGSRRNAQLVWAGYSVSTRRGAGETAAAFDLAPPRFPPFYFSVVRSYHAQSDAPLL